MFKNMKFHGRPFPPATSLKIIVSCCFLCTIFVAPSNACSSSTTQNDIVESVLNDPLVTSFKPDIHITQALPQDQALLTHIKQLFYEADGTANKKLDVYQKSVRNFGGQEVILLTQDNMRISALYFKRENAIANLVYIPGYFFDLTPTKEWGAPFSLLYPQFNVLIIDWRGTGDSEGINGFLKQNSFGKNAYPDIQATVDFMHKENDKPTILLGFCFGAAMIMHATIQAQAAGQRTADALVLNCLFTRFENQFRRATGAEDRCLYKILFDSGIAEWLIEYQADGSLFEVNPIDMIKDIKTPCYFEHYTFDPFATIHEGIEVFQAATCPKMFMRSDIGRHVRMHSKIPFQYQQAFISFLNRFGIIQNSVQQNQVPAVA